MTTLNNMVKNFLGIYDLATITMTAIQRIPYLARCVTYESFLETGTIMINRGWRRDKEILKTLK